MAQQNILKGHLKASGLIKRVTEQWDLTTQCSFEELWWCVQSVIVRERENESDRQTSRQTGRQAGGVQSVNVFQCRATPFDLLCIVTFGFTRYISQ